MRSGTIRTLPFIAAALAIGSGGAARESVIHNTDSTSTQVSPPVQMGSAPNGQYFRRNQRKMRRDARRAGLTVRQLKYGRGR